MFCSNCGYELNENSAFCPSCGQKIISKAQEEVQNEVVKNETPGEVQEVIVSNEVETTQEAEKPQVEAEVLNEDKDDTSLNTDDTNQVPKKKKSKKKIIMSVIAVLLVGAIGFGAYAAPVIANWARKTFMSDKEYFKYVIEDNIEEFAESFADSLDDLKESMNFRGSVEAETTVTIGDGLKDLYAKFLPGEAMTYVNALNTIGATGTGSISDDQISASAKFKINGTHIFTMNIAMDFQEGAMYLSIPEVSPETVRIPWGELLGENINPLKILTGLSELIPDSDLVEKVIIAYGKALSRSFDDIKVEDKDITVNGDSKSVTVLKADLNAKLGMRVLQEFLQTTKTDKDVRDLAQNFASEIGISLSDSKYDQALNEAISAVEDRLNSENNENSENASMGMGAMMGAAAPSFGFYVDSKGDLVGFGIEAMGTDIYYVNYGSDSKINEEFKVSAMGTSYVSLSGKGSISGGKINATYSLSAMGKEIMNIKAQNLDKELLSEGVFSGKITISPSGDIVSSLPSELNFISGIKAVYEGKATSRYDYDMTCEVYYNDSLMVKAKGTSKTTKGSKVNIPKDYVDAPDGDPFKDADPTKLIGNLQKAGFDVEMPEMEIEIPEGVDIEGYDFENPEDIQRFMEENRAQIEKMPGYSNIMKSIA